MTDRGGDQLTPDLLAAAVAASANGIVITDAAGSIVWANPAFTRMTGYSLAEAKGKNPKILKSGRHEESFYRDLWSTISSGIPWRGEVTNRRKDGSLYTEEMTITPVAGADGRITNYIAIKQDITERNRLADHVRHSQRLEAVGVLAGGVAHDFNNLLTVINGHCSLLLETLPETSPITASLIDIREAGERAAALTRQLLAFSRRQVLRPTLVDVNAAVKRLGSMLRRIVREDIRLVITLEPALAPVLADEGQLDQVVMNLVVNARDAISAGGQITIETASFYADETYAQAHPDTRAGDYVVIAISDTGVGMDEATKSRLFEPFFTTKPVHKGTGLGLSTVYGIVRQSGGWIWVYSEPGKGSTFKVYLPRAEPRSSDAQLELVQPDLQKGTETVLLVEDEPALLKLAASSLENCGYTILKASNGPAAIEIAAKHPGPIHLLLTDVIMPGMNGRELSNCLAPVRPEMRVLYMSGYTDDVIGSAGTLDSHVAYLQKPFSPNDLARRVREVLSAKSSVKVLVVDDDAAVRRFLHRALEAAGFDVREAVDGRQAVAAVRSDRFSAIVLDLVMPEQEGIETIRILRSDFPAIPILAISGAYGGTYLPLAKPLGAHSVMMKPIEPDALVREIRKLISATDAHR
ncbi:MAG TPA: response regulator [Candidatus Acidoferrales bacterium]|nr:response regulator [Bryobacteraceae bacterium]HTS64100.1 response regulator [Candidatus Acidoferrales bacterium]